VPFCALLLRAEEKLQLNLKGFFFNFCQLVSFRNYWHAEPVFLILIAFNCVATESN